MIRGDENNGQDYYILVPQHIPVLKHLRTFNINKYDKQPFSIISSIHIIFNNCASIFSALEYTTTLRTRENVKSDK